MDYVSTYPARDPSPVQEARLPSVQESPGDNGGVLELVRSPQYTAKVEYGLKMGYSEKLTQKALTKVGLDAGQDELLQELIRLQEAKTVDPEEIRLKEMQELLRASIPNQPAQEIVSSRTKGSLKENTVELRSIVIDGSNVAMSHGNPVGTFSCRGIQICVDWFWKRGHKDIVVFVPKWRKEASKVDVPITAQNLLEEMEKKRQLVFTPSRQFLGKRIACHDDRYILNYAAENDAVVVSNDNYRELISEKLEYKKVIEERILMYSFVNDTFMPPDDPLGKNGPSLETFLRLKTSTGPNTGMETKACPYKEKCTYGNKCKFFHAERGNVPHKSVTERLKEQSSKPIQELRTRNTSRDSSPGEQLTRTRSMNLPLHRTESDVKAKQQLARTRSSRPSYGPTQQEALYRLSKVDVAKTKSVEHSSTRFPHPPHSLRNVSIGQLEMGCLSTYGATQPPPHFPSPGFTPLQPPPQDQNQHRRLERQLTINPSFDPRINKEKVSPKHNPPLLDMEYMRRNLPPPLGLPPQQADDFPHQNVTRNASAPDSIRQWGSHQPLASAHSLLQPLGGLSQGGLSPPPPLEEVARNTTVAPPLHSPMQRLNSTSDTQLNRGFSSVNRALSSDPFSSSDTWKYRDFSPLLGSPIWKEGSPIWCPAAGPPSSPPKLDTPPPSPNRNLGPVGSRPIPSLSGPSSSESRAQLHFHLCGLFPNEQVEHVMKLMPEEGSPKVLCATIMELFPAK